MTLDECITILTEHNHFMKTFNVVQIVTEAIDYAIEELNRLKGLEK